MANLTPQQRSYIRKRTKHEEPGPDETDDELNIVPFLDIVVNLIMFLLMVTSSIAFYSQVEAQLPSYGRGGSGARAANENPLNLSVNLTANGIIVAGSGGKLAPGCNNTTTGRVLTVPKVAGGDYDWDALRTCAQRVKAQFADEVRVTISAEDTIEYQHVIFAMDAVRDDGEGNELFPEVLLSAGVR